MNYNLSTQKFFKDLKLVNTMSKRNIIILFLSFLVSSFFDILGLSLIGPYTEYFFFDEVNRDNYLIKLISLISNNQNDIFLYSTMFLIIIFISKAFFGFYVVKKIIYFSNIEQAKLITKLSINILSKNKKNASSAEVINNFLYNIRIFTDQTLITTLRLCSEMVVVIAILSYLFISYFLVSVLIFMSMFIAIFTYIFLIQKKLIKFGKVATVSSHKVIQETVNIMSGIKDIIIYSKEKFFRNQIKNNTYNQMINSANATTYAVLPKYFYDGFFISIFILILYFGSATLTKNEVIVYISVMGLATYRLLPCLFQISLCISNLKFSKSHFQSIVRLTNDLNKENELEKNFKSEKKYTNIESLNLLNINFKYQNETNKKSIFENFNINLNKGEKVYLHGNSGKGKTTIANIICGFDKFENGKYIVNNDNILNIKKFAKENIAYCSQNPFITQGSIIDNITMFEENINNEKLEFAVEASCFKEVLKKKNISLNHEISDLGENFSGGEKQRIQIARSLYFDKKIIIFDETTSAIEIDLERKILENLSLYLNDKIFLFISHRKSNLEFFDRIIDL